MSENIIQVIIAGGAGSGKTTLAHMLQVALDRNDISCTIQEDENEYKSVAHQLERIKALAKREQKVVITTLQTMRPSLKGDLPMFVHPADAYAGHTKENCNCPPDYLCTVCHKEKMDEIKEGMTKGTRRSAIMPTHRCPECKTGLVSMTPSGTICDNCGKHPLLEECEKVIHDKVVNDPPFDPLLGPIPCPDDECMCTANEMCQVCYDQKSGKEKKRS